MFTDKVAVVTGGASGIGKIICDELRRNNAKVCIIDIKDNDYFVGDIADEKTLISFADKVKAEYGKIDFLINNAAPPMGGLDDYSYEDFNYALKVGVSSAFMLTKLFKDSFNQSGSIINISSTRARMSQANTESYSAAKGAISALTHALAVSLSEKVRVNSISPGWIETKDAEHSVLDNVQHPAGRVGNSMDIANMIMFLLSDKAGFITGENITIDGGMSHMMIYHNDKGWKYSL